MFIPDETLFQLQFVKRIFVLLCLLFGCFSTEDSEEKGVVEIPCGSDELPCDHQGCIQKGRWCDTIRDCPDGSDERYCANSWSPKPKCLEHHFQCADGTCIPINGRCDGTPDCADESDEDCGSKRLIPLSDHSKADRTDAYVKDSGSDLSLEISRALKRGSDWMKTQIYDVIGVDKARALVALLLTNERSFTKKPWEKELLFKQLELQLLLDMVRNESKASSLAVLSLYINGILASCQNPRNFHGVDLILELRLKTDAALDLQESLTPLAMLTLCVAGDYADKDVAHLYNSINYGGHQIQRLDLQSLAVMALSCMIRDDRYARFKDILHTTVKTMIQNLDRRGAGDVYTSGLFAQALISAGSDVVKWDNSSLVRSILTWQKSDGSFGDLLSTYYVLPVLAGKSLVALKDLSCSSSPDETGPFTRLMNSGEKEIRIQYSLWLSSPPEEIHTLKLNVPFQTSFFDIMRLAAEENRMFRFKTDTSSGVRSVYSIANIPNDAERGYYWTLHVQNGISTSSEEQEENDSSYQGGIENLYPRNGTHLIFWLKNVLPQS